MLILSGLAIGFMVLQNLAGMEMGNAPSAWIAHRADGGIDFPTGGVAPPWPGPITPLEPRHLRAQELGLVANMIGLIAACTIGARSQVAHAQASA